MAPRLILGLQDLIRHVVDTLDTLLNLVAQISVRTQDMEKNMATKAQIEQMFTEQSTVLADYVGDVNAKMAELNTKLDAALANDSADAAALAEMRALTDDVVTRGTAITDAIKAADVAVDRPAPEA